MRGKRVFRAVGMTLTGLAMCAAIVIAVIAVVAVVGTVLSGRAETTDAVKPAGVQQVLPTVTATPPTTTIMKTLTLTATPPEVVTTVTVTKTVSPTVVLDYSESPNLPTSTTTSVVYRNCDQVRAAGKAPLFAGQPGYSRLLDADGDGVACER